MITVIEALAFVLFVAVIGGVLMGASAADAATDPAGGHTVRLRCEGTCPGATPHEADGAGWATCRSCGTPRRHLTPDET